jgi:hypothetical protein
MEAWDPGKRPAPRRTGPAFEASVWGMVAGLLPLTLSLLRRVSVGSLERCVTCLTAPKSSDSASRELRYQKEAPSAASRPKEPCAAPLTGRDPQPQAAVVDGREEAPHPGGGLAA